MKFRKINSDYVIKMEKGDDVIKEIIEFCEKENIRGGYFTGIGAASRVILGWFDPIAKVYSRKEIVDNLEITSLVGNVGRMPDGEVLLHTHITLSDKNYAVIAGHVFKCEISLVSEIFFRDLGEEVAKDTDPEFHLNFLKM